MLPTLRKNHAKSVQRRVVRIQTSPRRPLASGRLGDVWIRTTRRWTLFAWFFLSVGNMLGGRWAYEELGWGGYWAWDPVENAAFMPWLACTAFPPPAMSP